MWPSFTFKAAFALGALAHSFSGSIAARSLHLGDVATVLLDLVCLSLFCFFMSFQTDWKMMRSDICVEDCCRQTPGANKNISGLLQLMVKLIFGNVN